MERLRSNKRNKQIIISIVATKSGTGKTTLLEAVIKILKDRGYTVGVLKHDAHRLKIDKEGKDSYRFSQAGADNVIISSSQKMVMIQKLEEERPVEEIIRLFNGLDIVLMEGFKMYSYPKIEVHRKGVDSNLLCKNPNFDISSFIAVASDETLDVDIPVLDLNNPTSVADFIDNKLIKKR